MVLYSPTAKAADTVSLSPILSLGRPLACSLDGPCWIAQYPDRDPGPGTTDSACGLRSYHSHDGTDFAIPDQKTLTSGIDVLAIADGTVLRVRDGVPDQKFTKETPDSVKGIECGNGFLIDHGNGWQSQYCHLKQGSVKIRPDTKVKIGQTLGQVGQSGKAEFPHLHITLRKDGKAIDPFTATPIDTPCNAKLLAKKDLWRDDAKVTFKPVQITRMGLSGKKPDQAALEQDSHTLFRHDSEALIVWAEIWGVRAGDILHITLQNPEGQSLLTHKEDITAPKARLLQYAGLKRKAPVWPAGHYTGIIRLERAGMEPIEKKIILAPVQ